MTAKNSTARPVRARSRAPIRPMIAALATATSCGAWAAEPNPYYFGVSQGLTHDSNVFRTPGGPSDNYSSTGLLGGFDQMISRQRVYATAHVDLNRFQDQQQLNNTSYGVNTGWDWATIEKLSGNVYARLNQNLASLNDNTLRPSNERNLSTNKQFGARARWGGDAALTLLSGYGHSSVSYSAPAFQSSASSQDSFDIGVNYRVGATLVVGSVLRFTHTEADQALVQPNGTFLSNTTNGRAVELTAQWDASVQTRTSTRVSWTNRTNSGVGNRDYSGLTGSFDFSYVPTAKLSFTGSLGRDAGTNGISINATDIRTNTLIAGRSENSQVANSLALGATYAATSKINVNAGVQYRHSTIVDALNAGTLGSSREYGDTSRSLSLGANYAISRNWSMACNLAHVERDVGGTVPFKYGATTANCSTQYTLR